MKNASILNTEQLSFGYTLRNNGEKVVHRGLNLSLKEGELTCLFGLNGAGKSTLLRTLAGFQAPLQGKIEWIEKDINGYSERERSKIMGVVLNDKISVGGITVYEMVAMGRYPYTGFWGKLSKKDHKIIAEAIEQTGIMEIQRQVFAELSEGEKQLVMITKALAQECPILLLDEPTALLDINSRIETMLLLHKLARQGKSILLSTHDIDLALQIADSLWLIDRERDFISGFPEDLIFDGTFTRFFGSSDIAFDLETGTMRVTHANTQPIFVDTEHALFYWINNALTRNGFHAVTNPLESDIHLITKEYPAINIYYEGDMRWTVNSIEELIRSIRLL